MIFDLIIIGASASGMSAAIYAARAGLNFLVITKDMGGNAIKAGLVENYLGFPSIAGMDLIKTFQEHLEKYTPNVIFKEIESIEQKNTHFLIKAGEQNFEAKTVIIASGADPETLKIPGEKEFFNKGVSYCETCDGPIFAGKDVAIIGGGNSALKAVVALSKIVSYIYLVVIENELQGERVMIEKAKQIKNVKIIYQAKTTDFFGANFLEGLHYQDLNTGAKKEIKISGAFIYIGVKPNTKFISANLDILNEKKEIIVDKSCQTKIPSLFAAGDVVDNQYRQISIAVGEGARAALSAINYLDNVREQ
ncbi:thioredoxin-disulfide reductase [bacterium]|nr:MAG: thioredoxin-disulfide reductase [bacterium]